MNDSTIRVCKHPLSRQVTLSLPVKQPITIRGEADYYGASRLIGNAVGLSEPPRSRVGWQHGWANGPITDPRQVIGRELNQESYLVANQRLETLLRKNGIPGHAVGSPIVYANKPSVDRIGSSLLVMPAHSTHDSKHSINPTHYIDWILSQRAHFDNVLVCVAQSCVDSGYWVNDFDREGIAWVAGAAIDDGNALVRMRTLFSMFEVVTSNAIGSHFAYAALHGCRISLSGPEHRIAPEDLTTVGFYRDHPDLIEPAVHRTRRETIVAQYPHLDKPPSESETAIQWARSEVGDDIKKTPQQMVEVLRWRWYHRMQRNVRRTFGLPLRKAA